MRDPEAVPADVRRLLDERRQARADRDWPRADALRDRIAALGWEVQDAADGSAVRPMLPEGAASTGYAGPDELDSLLDQAPAVAASVQVVAEDHPADLERLLAGMRAHPPAASWELVVVANAPSFDPAPLLEPVGGVTPNVLSTSERLGWADSRTMGLRRSVGEMTVVLDTSLEPTGDFIEPLLAAFADSSVGLAGGWGVTSADGRSFAAAPPGEVDAIEAYCLAIRRDALRPVGGFDRRFRFYRNADLDFSFAVRDAGWRAVRTEPLPFARHEHRGWTSLPPAERDRLSKRNFYRFLKHWGDRRDLLVASGDR